MHVQKFSTIDITRFILPSVEQTIQVWIGSRQKKNEIECSKDDAERPTLLIHYKRGKLAKASVPRFIEFSKREVLSDENSINSIEEDLHIDCTPNCQRSDFFIHFSDLGWSSWILSPSGYQAGKCTGHCHSPLSVDTKPTNYASIMSVLKEVGHPGAVGPHCVPSILDPLPLLLHEESGNVILKLYEDMVVRGCSCK